MGGFLLAVIGLGLAATTSRTMAQVLVPVGLAGVEGDAAEFSLLGREDNRVQLAFGDSALALAGLKAGDRIVGLSFRLDGDEPLPLTAQTIANYTIVMATSTRAPGLLESVFTDNLGPDATTVRSGSITFGDGTFPADGAPASLGTIPFLTAFTYLGGPLVLDISHTTFPEGGRSVDAFTSMGASDFQAQFGSPGSLTADLGSVAGAGTVVRFDVAAVPEPETWAAVMALGCGGWVVARRLARQRAPGRGVPNGV